MTSIITAQDAALDNPHHDFVYLIASPDTLVSTICGVQIGIEYDTHDRSGPGLDLLGWHTCSDLEFPSDGWPSSGSGNTMTWTGNPRTDVIVVGYFEVVAHGPSRMRVAPWPVTGMAKIANCKAAEYTLQVPPDRLGWVSWGHAGFGADTDGCNPVLGPCQSGPVPVRPSTWGRLKSLYAH